MTTSPSINTLRYAQKLKDAGMARGVADAMAQALNEELADRMLTKADLAQALVPIHGKLAEVDQRFDAVDAKVDALDAKVDAKIDALDAKVDAKIDALDAKVDTKIDALDAKVDAKIDALDAKVDAKIDGLGDKFNSLSTKFVFGFSTVFLVLSSLMALGVLQFMRATPPAAPVAAVVERPAEPSFVGGGSRGVAQTPAP